MTRCSACGVEFGGTTAFDHHRIGNHAYVASSDRPDGRRCLSTDEMQERGYHLNKRGTWSRSGFASLS
jgi:hypothetical protein